MEIGVWFIIAQILGVITIGFEFASYQIKDKRKYLLVNGIGSMFWALMFLAMGMATTMSTQLNLFIVGIYSSVRALVFWWITAKDSKRRRVGGRIFLLVMLAIALGAGITLIVGLPTRETQILQAIALFFALCFVIGQYLPGKHPVRITVFMYAVILLLNATPLAILDGHGIERWNVMGIIIELAKMTSVIVFYCLMMHRQVLVNKLEKIKAAVNCQMTKINSFSPAAQLTESGLICMNQLEKLVAKMVRLELSVIDKEQITNCTNSEQQTKAMLDDLKTVHDVKMMMEKVIRLKLQKIESKPIPKVVT